MIAKKKYSIRKGGEKRGPKATKEFTIKYQKGQHYLYTWDFDIEMTNERRKEVEDKIERNLINELSDDTLWNKTSRYKWKNRGRIHFVVVGSKEDEHSNKTYKVKIINGSGKDRLSEYVEKNKDKIGLIEEDIENRLFKLVNDPDKWHQRLPKELIEYYQKNEMPLPRI